MAAKSRDFFDDYSTSGFTSRSKYEEGWCRSAADVNSACAYRVLDRISKRLRATLLNVDLCSYLDWMMIYSNRNPRRKARTHLVRNGKWSIEILPRKIWLQAIPIMAIPRRIVGDTGTEEFLEEILHSSLDLISSSSKPSTSYSTSDNGDAQKRFTNAKAISSDQFFNKDSDVSDSRASEWIVYSFSF